MSHDYILYGEVSPGSTATIDSVLLSETHLCKWILVVTGSFGTMMGEVRALETRGEAHCVVFGILGNIPELSISVETDGSSLILKATNNDSEALTIKYNKVKI